MSTKDRLNEITNKNKNIVNELLPQILKKCEIEAEKGNNFLKMDINFGVIKIGKSSEAKEVMVKLKIILENDEHKLSVNYWEAMFAEPDVIWVIKIHW